MTELGLFFSALPRLSPGHSYELGFYCNSLYVLSFILCDTKSSFLTITFSNIENIFGSMLLCFFPVSARHNPYFLPLKFGISHGDRKKKIKKFS